MPRTEGKSQGSFYPFVLREVSVLTELPLGSGSAIRKNARSGSVSGSALNQCGSETLSSPELKGEGTNSPGGEGVGVPNSDDWRKSLVPYSVYSVLLAQIEIYAAKINSEA